MWMNECLACPSAKGAGVEAWIRHLAEAHVMPTEWTSERAARLVGPAARTPYTLITESKKKRCRGSVPRPLNSFMIFAQHIRRNVLRVFGKASNSVISRQLGEIWRTLPRSVKERYDAEAARLVKIHQIEFPDYKYQPKKKSTPASLSTNLLSGGCDVHRKRAATMPSVNQLTARTTRLPSVSIPVAERTHNEQQQFADWYSSPNVYMSPQQASGDVYTASDSPNSSFCETSFTNSEHYSPIYATRAASGSPINQSLQNNDCAMGYSLTKVQQRQRYLSAENSEPVQPAHHQAFVTQYEYVAVRSASCSYPVSQNMKPDQLRSLQHASFACLSCTQQGTNPAQFSDVSFSLCGALPGSNGDEQELENPPAQVTFKQPLEGGAYREDVTGVVRQTGYVPTVNGNEQLPAGIRNTYCERVCQNGVEQEFCSPSLWYSEAPISPLKTPDSGYFDSGHSQWSSIPGTLSPASDAKPDWSVFC